MGKVSGLLSGAGVLFALEMADCLRVWAQNNIDEIAWDADATIALVTAWREVADAAQAADILDKAPEMARSVIQLSQLSKLALTSGADRRGGY